MKLTRLMAALAAVGLASGALAAGQAADTAEKAEQNEKIARVEVTGSSLKRINAETASPVQVIDAKQIENMGARTVSEVLANLPAAQPGLQDFASTFTGSDGGSSANLRGLGAQATLVLLNGHRLSAYGALMGGRTQFVNIDAIPAAAIERMEVLTDGASAVYGSDAIAGVINIITKKSYQGLELKASADKSSKVSSYGQPNVGAVYGLGDMGKDGFNVFGSVNLFSRNRVSMADTYQLRPAQYYVNNPAFITNFQHGVGTEPGVLNPGSYFVFDPKKNNAKVQQPAPGCTTTIVEAAGPKCVWDTLPYATDRYGKSDRVNVFLGGRLAINPDTEAFTEVALSHIDVRTHTGPRALTSGSTISWYARNTGNKLNTFVVPYLGPNNVYNKLSPELQAMMGGAAGLNYVLQDGVNNQQENVDNNYRFLAGLRGSLGNWDYETSVSVAGSHSTLYQSANYNTAGFEKAFGPFTVDPVTGRTYMADNPAYQFGVISDKNAALIRELNPIFDIHSLTKLITLDGKIEGTLATLPGGDVRTAFGFNVMRDSIFVPGNPDAAAGRITQQGGPWYDGKRWIGALFTETLVPITKNLDVEAAARLDKYPHFAANLAPKIGVKYRPTSQLMFRGTYSEGFRAPNLPESGIGGRYGQFGGVVDTIRCDETNAIANLLLKSVSSLDKTLGKSLLNSNCSSTVGGLTVPKKDLQPEKAKISTIGIVLQPVKWFDISADYWFVYRRNQISLMSPNDTYRQEVAKYGPTLAGSPNAVRMPISDADRGNMGAVAAMCQNPANAAACAAGIPTYSVGNLGGLTSTFLNRGRTMVDGFDVDAHARFPLGGMGRLNLGAAATIMKRDQTNGDDGGGFSQNWVGYYGNPKVRATFNADWAYQKFVASMFVNYTGGNKWATDIGDEAKSNPNTCKAANQPLAANECGGVPSFYNLNLGLTWTPTAALKVGFNIKNVLNNMPYYDPRGADGYNGDIQNLFGRVFSVTATYKFR